MKKFLIWLGFQDAFEKGLIGRILVIFCLIFISFGAVFLIYRLVLALHPDFSYGHWTDLLLESLIFVFGLVSLWLIRTDRTRAASWVILGVLLVVVSLEVCFVADPANDIAGALGLQLFAVLAFLLLGRRDRWVAVILAVGVYVGFNALSTTGRLIPVTGQDPANRTLFSVFVWLSVSIIITAVLLEGISAMRREPQLIQQRINESAQSNNASSGQKSLPYLSTRDPLTGLFNRLFFEAEFTRLENSRLFPISIIMADIDGLKKVNDAFGQTAGDQILINVARIFTKVFRNEDIISRYGGDEFAILLPGADESIAKRAVKRINQQVKAYNEKHSDQPISLSMGTSTANRGDSLKSHLKTAGKLLRHKMKKVSPV